MKLPFIFSKHSEAIDFATSALLSKPSNVDVSVKRVVESYLVWYHVIFDIPE